MSTQPKQFDVTIEAANLTHLVDEYVKLTRKYSSNDEGVMRIYLMLKQAIWHKLEAAYLSGLNDGIEVEKELNKR